MERLTKEQAAIIGTFTGILAGPFSDLQEYAETKLGKGISTVGMAMFADDLKKASEADFMALTHERD